MLLRTIIPVLAVLVLSLGTAVQTEAGTMTDETALTEREKSIVVISAFTASGDLERLKPALNAGLDAGLTVNEIKEVLVQMYAYAGFPRSLNGLGTFNAVTDERKARGIVDEVGREASPVPADMDKDAYGAKVRAQLVGLEKDISGLPWQVFSPTIDIFLKEHLFADIFARDVLNHRERELATIGALAAMRGTQSQLRSHLGISLNAGLTPSQLRDFTEVIEMRVGHEEGESAKAELTAVLDARKQ
ncbi:carboxymuconolactone decarboxylase family protein [Pseudodesulfovibrio thermohalotolerans]|uniref:carboxymuconolactone decarboxylase family protein n=1 Tax=Pseudodesulfovibrio thermohalotolerans TaxID=2880651 RepID=UPI0024411415|nr:carboxymuconolactone decarboxylase family protein [Pseudodesulfovibrio thermohalotolerans]WFS61825.1 carboxymuconolactone decarboxylase family protein [Pseudodesulfovibrio thermohalotolerans]